MTKLIYHNEKSLTEKASPFDKAIFELVENKSIKVVSPYITLSYLKRILNFSNGDWLLITDLNELIKSQTGKNNRIKVKSFISDNRNRVRHCTSLHAKAIITNDKIFFGSANFTSNGITRNNELSVLIDELDKVIELNNWFDEWWEKSIIVEDEQITELILSTMDKPKTLNPFQIQNAKSKINCSLFSLPDKDSVTGQITEEELASYLSKWGNRNWTNSYFDLMKEVIEHSELENSDDRFAITVRRKKTGKSRIPLIIGQRYVTAPFYNNDKDFGTGLIMSLDYNLENMNKDKVILKYQERALNGKGGFTRNKKIEAYWLVFDTKDEIAFSEEVKNHWKNAVNKELKRTKYSRSRPNHQPIIYEAVMDLEFRKEILDLSFK